MGGREDVINGVWHPSCKGYCKLNKTCSMMSLEGATRAQTQCLKKCHPFLDVFIDVLHIFWSGARQHCPTRIASLVPVIPATERIFASPRASVCVCVLLLSRVVLCECSGSVAMLRLLL